MSTEAQQAELATVEFITTLFEENKEVAIEAIKNAEGGAEAFVGTLIKEGPRPGGAAGILVGYIEGQIPNMVASMINKNGPEVVFDFIDAALKHQVATLKAAVGQ